LWRAAWHQKLNAMQARAFFFLAASFAWLVSHACAELRVGVARIDITPDYPVRLSGFGFRRAESEGITQRIWAKAIAFADEERGPAILIATDNLGVPEAIALEVAERVGVKRERLTITASHTHTAPMLRGVAPTLFGLPIPDDHQANIERYTREFTERLVEVGRAALNDARPARVEWAIGRVGFAKNRRTPGGPVDHDLPLLVVREPDGKFRAIWFAYACHCVTLADNKLSGDWAGFAQSEIERDFPGATALMSAGCGADSNPTTRDSAEIAASQGRQVADEVKRLLAGALAPITAQPATQLATIALAFDTPRTRAEWEERAKRADAVGHHARVNLGRLDRGETLPTEIAYPIQTWRFADQLALVMLPGEVVVDYSLRLKRELNRSRLAVVAYANDATCYIPSERVLKEGGYEGGDAMIYYDRPNKFAPGLEEKIIAAVHAQLPGGFEAKRGTEGTRPLSPEDSLRCIRMKSDLDVQLVAAEPAVQSPVAIDWDTRGRLWVCEMFDYPTGLDEKWKPGGRIKILSDSDGDGRFDTATLFLDGLPFPTGVMCWRKGALVCAAPDILLAEDTDDDGQADAVRKLITGFATDNYQARVNGLALGLDGWVYGANGLLGGKITGGTIMGALDIRGHDFRFRPDTGEFETVAGLTQHGRVRDDWGHWFGCENSRPLFHFPLEDRYLARNPRVAAPPPSVNVPAYPDSNRIFPISAGVERFNDPQAAGHFTSACGIGVYRDTLLSGLNGSAFVCEPVHNLVHREMLATDGITISGRRADDEKASEFLASSDPWFRPVQVRTGPDGGLYVVDMYRFLVEHPRWIAAERLAKIEARAGAEMGRIFRLLPKGTALRPVRDLTKLGDEELPRALDTPNGTERDRVQLAIVERRIVGQAASLSEVQRASSLAEVRVQALSTLDALGGLTPAHVASALADAHPRVREQGVRLCERFRDEPSVRTTLFGLANSDEPDRGVRLQLALTLGEFLDDSRARDALAKLAASADATQPHFRAALRSSSRETAAPTDALPFLTAASDNELKRLGADPPARASVLEKYQPALALNGDVGRGMEVFARACALCHALRGVGFALGPDLAALRDKPADYWLKNILDPNAAIEPRFLTQIVAMKDGRTFAGIVRDDTATSLTLAQPGGIAATLLRADVAAVRGSSISLMPADLDRTIAPQEMADLIACLSARPSQ
jgi:putative membrane-bound dehydrogenase-like protein